ncbi:hypothetical protein LINPERHAP2_LOCUS25442, partial [Linum perenne]
NLAIQTDFVSAIQIICKADKLGHQRTGLVLRFQELFWRDWEVHIEHIYRENNFLADFLVKWPQSTFWLSRH